MKYDVFISHASEDKADFVQALAQALDESGLSVWYDEFSLHLGDSLRESIGKGLSQSSFGIVVLSPNFFRKKWPIRELSALISREDAEEKVILPIWHRITKDEVLDSFPLMADKLAVMSKEGMPNVIRRILEVVKPSLIAEKHYEEGLMFEENELLDEAIAAYIKALRIDQNHPDALCRITRLSKPTSLYVSETTIKIGIVRFNNEMKGFALIAGEDGKEYFAYFTDIEEGPTIHGGDKVAFLWEKKARGRIARLVRII